MEGDVLQAEPLPAAGADPGPRDAAAPSVEVRGLLRLHVPVIVRLAERKMRLDEIMKLTASTIIELGKPSGEPLDLLVNNVAIGQGDVVKVGENFGLRITRIGTPGETIRALGGGA